MPPARNKAPHVPHACGRALERYGLRLEVGDLGKICRRIQNNDGTTFDGQEHTGATRWFMEYNGVKVRVLISQDFYRVITFLPIDDSTKHRPPRKRKRRKIYINGRAIWMNIDAIEN